MEIMSLAFYTEENADFFKILGQSICRLNRNVEIISIPEEAKIDQYKYDLLLSDTDINCSNKVKVIFDNSKSKDECFIHVYEGVERIFIKLIEYCYDKTGKIFIKDQNFSCKLISLFSPYGGSGVTSIGVGLGKTLNQYYGFNVLYISLCAVNGCSLYIQNKKEDPSRKLCYYMESKKEFPIEPLIVNEDISYIQTSYLNSINKTNITWLHKLENLLSKQCDYEYILLDIGDNLSSENIEIIAGSDVSVCILDNREKYLYEKPLSSIHNLCDGVSMYVENNIFTDPQNQICTLDIWHDEKAFIFEKTYKDINFKSDFAYGLRELSEKIMEMANDR